ncbi:hypothetical protein CTheo_6132 [Ceratobasidium theobromae]|uniref:Uncharacterized protein n=1 Tax=Ceratobasidium theobromae TaxID=1582974 RepID=A0A5N5QF86_9AGAM|nr:hypothetical protein CTheo_6132 [Ceratobasidium theobromae]
MYTIRERDEIGEPDDWNGPGGSHSLGRGPNRPQLRQVELHGLPSILIFNPYAPVVSDLISLTLVGSSVIPSVQRISTMLSSNPQLESLHLGMDILRRDLFDPNISLAQLRVQLPNLRSLVLSIKAGFGWGLQLLQIIDAPGLEYFELRSSYLIYGCHSELDPQVLFWHIAVGRVHGALQLCLPPKAKPPNSGSIFPSLCHLNIQQLYLADQRRLLEAFPSITQVTLNEHALHTWVEHPSLLPNISLIKYAGQANETVRKAMSSITFQGADAGTTPLFKEIILAKHIRMYAVIAPNRVLEDGVDSVIHSLYKFADMVDLCKPPVEVYDSNNELIDEDDWLDDDEESSNGDGNEA